MNKEKTIFVGSGSYGNTFDEYWNRIMELENKCNKYKEILDKVKDEIDMLNIVDCNITNYMICITKINEILEEIE